MRVEIDMTPVMEWRWAWVAMLIIAFSASGEELEQLGVSPLLSLSTVVEKAFERNPQQHVLQAGESSVAARTDYAGSMLPGVPAMSFLHQSDAIGSGNNLREWAAALELPVWMPGQRAAREAVAREARDGLETSRSSLKLDLAGQVREAVWDIAMNANSAELAAQRLKTNESLQFDVEKRWKAGELARTDVMLAQNETLQAQAAMLRTQAELRHAEHRYWMLTGLKQLPARIEEPLSPISEIENTHPLLADVSAKVSLAQGERELVRLEKRENPQLTINARRERGAFDNEYDNSIGLAVRVPLDTQVRSAPMLANAEMGLAQAMSARERLMLMLQTSLHEAEHNLEVTRSELKVVEEQSRLAQESLRLAKKAFDLGESDLVSLLRVQAMAREAERSLRSRQIQLQWDIARYNQAVGVLP
jgi:outer membrane protein, heavy metal efflux system